MPDLLTGFYFSVRVLDPAAFFEVDFKEVSGLEKEMKTEEVTSGGENSFKYKLPIGTTYPNLILRRGVSTNYSGLASWCMETLDNGFSTPIKTRDLLILLKDGNGQCRMGWFFKSAYPVKWSASDLKSQESEVLIESMELAYKYSLIEKI